MAPADHDKTDSELAQESLLLSMRSGGPGQPGLCPTCRQQGHLDAIVPASNMQFEHCLSCGCEWKRLFDYEGTVEIIQPAKV